MRILNRYIILDYLIIFFGALGLITFVMTVGALVKAVDLMARGISPGLITQFFLQNIPYILSFSMPISTLFAALLLFGRLSMDNEISAIKACGVSLWRLVAPLIILSILFSGVCGYINSTVAPEAKYANKQLLRSAGVEEPLNLIEEGRFINDFPGLMIYVGRKNGNVVKDVVVYELEGKDSTRVKRSIRASHGTVDADNENFKLMVKLYDGRMEEPDAVDPHDISKTTYTPFEYVQIPLDFEEMLKSGSVRRKRSHMTIALIMKLVRYANHVVELLPEDLDLEKQRNLGMVYSLEGKRSFKDKESRDLLAIEESKRMLLNLSPEDLLIEQSRLLIEANRRISTAIACFTFMLIGIPLGVKSHRKETSVGMVMSLAIVFVYYILIVIAKALAEYPEFHPNLILWLPMVGTQLLGFWLIRRSS